MTHIAGVRIRNWTRYRGQFEIELGPEIIAVLAEHENDSERSNFTGKTAFVSALRWCYYGTRVLGKQTLDELISYGEDSMQVDIEHSDGTFISRLKVRNESAQLEVQTPDGRTLKQDGAQVEIERFVGTQSDALSTWFGEQREIAGMIRATSGEATAQIEGWLGLERLVNAGDSLEARRLKKAREWAAASIELNALATVADQDHYLRVCEQVAELRVTYDAETEVYESRLARRGESQERAKLAELEAEELRIVRQVDALKDAGLEAPVDPKLVTDVNVKREAEALRRKVVNELRVVAEGEFDGTCPASPGFQCPVKEQINSRKSENQTALKNERAKLATQITVLEQAETALKDARVLEAAASRRETLHARESDRLKTLRAEIAVLRSRVKGEVGEEVEEPVRPDGSKLAEMEVEKRRIEKVQQELPEARENVARLAREVRVLRAAASVLGPNGARKVACLRAVQEIEAGLNKVLTDAGIDLTARAAWDRELGKPADQCFECGAAFPSSTRVKVCSSCGAGRGLKQKHEFRWVLSDVSGAAEDMAGLALRCAAFRRRRQEAQTSLAVAVLDEPASHFDRAHRRAFSAHLRRLLEGTFEQAFVSAHSDDVLASCQRKVLITGFGKWSRIEVR